MSPSSARPSAQTQSGSAPLEDLPPTNPQPMPTPAASVAPTSSSSASEPPQTQATGALLEGSQPTRGRLVVVGSGCEPPGLFADAASRWINRADSVLHYVDDDALEAELVRRGGVRLDMFPAPAWQMADPVQRMIDRALMQARLGLTVAVVVGHAKGAAALAHRLVLAAYDAGVLTLWLPAVAAAAWRSRVDRWH